jgi:hypothetical protein
MGIDATKNLEFIKTREWNFRISHEITSLNKILTKRAGVTDRTNDDPLMTSNNNGDLKRC